MANSVGATVMTRIRTVMRAALVAATVGTASIGVVGCNSGSVTDSAQVATIELSPTSVNVRAGAEVPLTVTLRDNGGKQVNAQTITWSSSNPTVATVSTTGLVRAIAPGQARVAASSMGKSGTVAIVVSIADVASVQVLPSAVEIRAGTTSPLTATPRDAQGTALTGRVISWTTSNAGVATVNAQGVVIGLAPGAATVTATCEGHTGTSAVTVSAVDVATVSVSPPASTIKTGETAQLTATVRDAAGGVLVGRTITWNSSNTLVASVSSTGLVTALSVGAATITASADGKSGTATVTVQPPSVGVVTLSPAANTIIVGTTLQLTAQVTDAIGNVLTGRPITYSSDNNSVATVNASGLVTAVATGQVTITATSEGRSGTASVRVVPVPVAAVTVSPPIASLLTGITLQLTATVTSSSGVPLTGRPVTWTSGATSVATVSTIGLVTAISPGVVVIFAEAEGVRGSSTITISAPAVASVSISPVAPTVNVSGTVQLTAVPRDRDGVALSNRTITWKSEDENVAFVTSTGLVIGLKAGAVFITATSEGVSGSTLVTVH